MSFFFYTLIYSLLPLIYHKLYIVCVFPIFLLGVILFFYKKQIRFRYDYITVIFLSLLKLLLPNFLPVNLLLIFFLLAGVKKKRVDFLIFFIIAVTSTIFYSKGFSFRNIIETVILDAVAIFFVFKPYAEKFLIKRKKYDAFIGNDDLLIQSGNYSEFIRDVLKIDVFAFYELDFKLNRIKLNFCENRHEGKASLIREASKDFRVFSMVEKPYRLYEFENLRVNYLPYQEKVSKSPRFVYLYKVENEKDGSGGFFYIESKESLKQILEKYLFTVYALLKHHRDININKKRIELFRMILLLTIKIVEAKELNELQEILKKAFVEIVGLEKFDIFYRRKLRDKNFQSVFGQFPSLISTERLISIINSSKKNFSILEGKVFESEEGEDFYIFYFDSHNPLIETAIIGKIKTPELFHDSEVYEIFNILFAVITASVNNSLIMERLFDLALNDALTGLYNRKYFNLRIEEAYKKFERYKSQFSLIMIDIDYFKKINDTYGHDAGDFVLKEIGKIILNSIRSVDIAARIGGEEFAILLFNAEKEEARILAERIREKVENHEFYYEGQKLKVTISLGVSSFKGEVSLSEFMKQTDMALYVAKKEGRNRVVVR